MTFKRWLWAVIEKMIPLEKQDLVYFWTGEYEIEYIMGIFFKL